MFKFKPKILHSLVVAGFFAFSSASHAAVTTFYFGSLLKATSGYTAPNNFVLHPFAQLETVNNGNVWTFTLSVNNNLFSSFGNNAYIGSMSFDFNPDPVNRPVSAFVSSNVGGVRSVASTDGGRAYGLSDIDFGTEFGKGSSNRLSQSDYVSWSVSGLAGTRFVNMYIDVKGLGSDGAYSAKYTPQGVTTEQLAALNAEVVRAKAEADRTKVVADGKKIESDVKRAEAERTATEKTRADALAAAAEQARIDALAAAAEQARIDALAAAAEQARIDAENARDAALAAEAERARAEEERVSAEDERARAETHAAEAEQARLDAEHKKADEEDFRHRVIVRDESEHDQSGGGSCVSPVPEPETYAMMLAGLGLIGFRARRRKQDA